MYLRVNLKLMVIYEHRSTACRSLYRRLSLEFVTNAQSDFEVPVHQFHQNTVTQSLYMVNDQPSWLSLENMLCL
jgi:hypothetical protein